MCAVVILFQSSSIFYYTSIAVLKYKVGYIFKKKNRNIKHNILATPTVSYLDFSDLKIVIVM